MSYINVKKTRGVTNWPMEGSGYRPLIHTRLGRFMRVRASHIAFIDYIEQYYRKKVEETGREWWNKRAHCARWSVRTQSAPASIGGNVSRIWKATADGRVCRAACASVETYQSSPNIFSDILDMKGIMQTPVSSPAGWRLLASHGGHPIVKSGRYLSCQVTCQVGGISDDMSHRGHNFDFQAIHHLKKIGRSSKDS